jgi:hypothetical protein
MMIGENAFPGFRSEAFEDLKIRVRNCYCVLLESVKIF